MKPEVKENLIQYHFNSSSRNTLFGMIAIGVVSILIAAFGLGHENVRHEHSNPAWSALLVGTFLVLGVAVAGIFFTAVSHISGSHWSITVRRIAETFSKFLPFGIALLAIILFFGLHDLFEWSHNTPEVQNDHLIQHKSAWLNERFFQIRLILIVGLWIFYGHIFYKRSTNQDSDGDVEHTKANTRRSAGFILLFALTFSIVSFDLLMSLTPHWFSTIFAVYIFAGIYQSTMSSMVILIYHLKKSGYLGELVNENHIHDLGKFMLSFTIFWAYVGFSQFMLIWYANMPEETFFFEERLIGGWSIITIAVPFIKFAVPFFLLLNRPNKRDIDFLVKIAIWIIFTEIIELYWIVFPSNFETFNPIGLVLTIGTSIGTIGLFGFIVLKKFESNKLIPVKDPRLDQCLNHHQ